MTAWAFLRQLGVDFTDAPGLAAFQDAKGLWHSKDHANADAPATTLAPIGLVAANAHTCVKLGLHPLTADVQLLAWVTDPLLHALDFASRGEHMDAWDRAESARRAVDNLDWSRLEKSLGTIVPQLRSLLDRTWEAARQEASTPQAMATLNLRCALDAASTYCLVSGGPGWGEWYRNPRAMGLGWGYRQAQSRIRDLVCTVHAGQEWKETLTGELIADLRDGLDLDLVKAAPISILSDLPAELLAQVDPSVDLASSVAQVWLDWSWEEAARRAGEAVAWAEELLADPNDYIVRGSSLGKIGSPSSLVAKSLRLAGDGPLVVLPAPQAALVLTAQHDVVDVRRELAAGPNAAVYSPGSHSQLLEVAAGLMAKTAEGPASTVHGAVQAAAGVLDIPPVKPRRSAGRGW